MTENINTIYMHHEENRYTLEILPFNNNEFELTLVNKNLQIYYKSSLLKNSLLANFLLQSTNNNLSFISNTNKNTIYNNSKCNKNNNNESLINNNTSSSNSNFSSYNIINFFKYFIEKEEASILYEQNSFTKIDLIFWYSKVKTMTDKKYQTQKDKNNTVNIDNKNNINLHTYNNSNNTNITNLSDRTIDKTLFSNPNNVSLLKNLKQLKESEKKANINMVNNRITVQLNGNNHSYYNLLHYKPKFLQQIKFSLNIDSESFSKMKEEDINNFNSMGTMQMRLKNSNTPNDHNLQKSVINEYINLDFAGTDSDLILKKNNNKSISSLNNFNLNTMKNMKNIKTLSSLRNKNNTKQTLKTLHSSRSKNNDNNINNSSLCGSINFNSSYLENNSIINNKNLNDNNPRKSTFYNNSTGKYFKSTIKSGTSKSKKLNNLTFNMNTTNNNNINNVKYNTNNTLLSSSLNLMNNQNPVSNHFPAIHKKEINNLKDDFDHISLDSEIKELEEKILNNKKNSFIKHKKTFKHSVCVYSNNEDHTDSVTCLLKLNPDKFITGSNDCSVIIWNSEGKIDSLFNLHKFPVLCLLKLNENYFASGSYDTTIKIYDVSNDRCISSLEKHNYGVTSMTCLNENCIISGSYKELFVWSCTKDQRIIKNKQYLKDGGNYKINNSISNDDTGYSNFRLVYVIKEEQNTFIFSLLQLNKDVFIYGVNKIFRVLKSQDYSEITSIEEHSNRVSYLVKLNDEIFASGSFKTIKLWEILTLNCVAILQESPFSISSLTSLNDEQFIVGSLRCMKIYDIKTRKNITNIEKAHTGWVSSISVLSDDMFVSGGAFDKFNSTDKGCAVKVWKAIHMKKTSNMNIFK